MNTIGLTGHLHNDPTRRDTPRGVVASFRLAVDDRPNRVWIDVTADAIATGDEGRDEHQRDPERRQPVASPGMDRKSFTPDNLSHYRDDWHMSPGIISNGLLFLTGMTGNRGDGTFASDPDEQVREAFVKITDVLAEAGLDYSHVVEMTSYHVGIHDHIDVFRKVRDEHVVEPYPAWTAIEVSGFITAGAIVEIRIVADASSIT